MNWQSPGISSLAPFNCSLCKNNYLTCHLFTSSIISQELNNSNIHQLLNLHLSIIQELQEKLIQKELELDTKTHEYSQLETKLLRLQRRLQHRFNESKIDKSISKNIPPITGISRKQKKIINAKLTLELRTHIHYLCHSISNNDNYSLAMNDNSQRLELPSFRFAQNTSSNSTIFPNSEDLSDNTFLRRHKKLEENEKRSKRWDSRRYRERKKVNDLQIRHDKANNKYSNCLDYPSIYTEDASEVKQIEVSDTVAIQGFGAPLPAILPAHFELNWIDDTKD